MAPAVMATIPARERSPCMSRRYKARRTAENAREVRPNFARSYAARRSSAPPASVASPAIPISTS